MEGQWKGSVALPDWGFAGEEGGGGLEKKQSRGWGSEFDCLYLVGNRGSDTKGVDERGDWNYASAVKVSML